MNPIPHQWRVAGDAQPTAQRHTDVPAWMSVWSRIVVAAQRLAEELEKATKRSAA